MEVKIYLASPSMIRSWSYGEIKTPDTLNSRTLKPERNGLFCAKIFGPLKDYECGCGWGCGKRGRVCSHCGVEITNAAVRRERMGHIELASPVAHILFRNSISLLLNMYQQEVSRVLNFEYWVVLNPGKSNYEIGQLLTNQQYLDRISEFSAQIGAEAIKTMLSSIDLRAEIEYERNSNSESKSKRIKLLEAFNNSGKNPSWMVMEVLPVLPPDLRPLLATSDINDLYRSVITRNNQLKLLLSLGAPDTVVHNEKRLLQESVDELFSNGKRGSKKFKSLADMIQGKHGRFRKNLLGKRVDYSGRTVITVGPTLRLHQCGIPKQMAIELFKPFLQRKTADLAEVISEHTVLLNRAPTLHRIGIQAFSPLLIDGQALKLHPLVCAAFNADFDGDQMAVHVPLTVEAKLEARVLMMSINNVLSPANGDPILVPSQDSVLGLYYMTLENEKFNARGEGMIFSNLAEVERAFSTKSVDLHARIKVRLAEKVSTSTSIRSTTVGRALLYSILPKYISFDIVNRLMKKKSISNLLNTVYRTRGLKETIILAEKLMTIGFSIATMSGTSICVNDLVVPDTKYAIIALAKQEVKYLSTLSTLSTSDKSNKILDVWYQANDKVANAMMAAEQEQFPINTMFLMADSGARGSNAQIRQLAGMRGFMTKPDGEIIDTPIIANLREGLNVLEYFISSHGARKGLADTALKTANSGYLTRRLVDVAQDVVITGKDCGTKEGLHKSSVRVLGRVVARDVVDKQKKVLIKKGTLLNENLCSKIDKMGINDVLVRSAITCEMKHGVCSHCYGRDLSRGHLINVGESVGIIAAQSIGEPGTQLTLRTFHIGGGVSGAVGIGDCVQIQHGGRVRMQQMVYRDIGDGKHVVISRASALVVEHGLSCERYKIPYGASLSVYANDDVYAGQVVAKWDPHTQKIIAEEAGNAKFVGKGYADAVDSLTGNEEIEIMSKISLSLPGSQVILPEHAVVLRKEGAYIKKGEIIARVPVAAESSNDITGGLQRVADVFEARKPKKPAILAESSGTVIFGKRRLIITSPKGNSLDMLIPNLRNLNVLEGETVEQGDVISDGPSDAHEILRLLGIAELTKYILEEIQDVYSLHGVNINEKHIEVIVRKMLRKVEVIYVGDSKKIKGDKIDIMQMMEENERLIASNKRPAQFKRLLFGITKASLATESFISAASFQDTQRVLTEAAALVKRDHMVGLKENVVVGRLIPAGTGFAYHAECVRT